MRSPLKRFLPLENRKMVAFPSGMVLIYRPGKKEGDRMRKKWLVLGLLLGTVGLLFGQESAKEIYRKYADRICLVRFYQKVASESRIGSHHKIKRYFNGIIVTPDGLVMVSSEVYPVSLDVVSSGGDFFTEMPEDFKVTLANGKEFSARFIGKDDHAAVGFVQIEGLPADTSLSYVTFVSDANLTVGDSLFILELLPETYQFQRLLTFRFLEGLVREPRLKYLLGGLTPRLSAGGLVLDGKGRAVGITLPAANHFSFDFMESNPGPISAMLEIAPSDWFLNAIAQPPRLSKQTVVRKSWLGIQMQGLNPRLQQFWKVPQESGVIVSRVMADSPAQKAGLQVGDVILAVNGQPLTAPRDEASEQLRNMIRSLSPGERVHLKVFRQGKLLSLTGLLTPAPKSLGLADRFQVEKLGIEIRELTRDVLYQQNLPLGTRGVFVAQVDRAAPAGMAGMPLGCIIQKINGQTVDDLAQAREIIQEVLRQKAPRFMFQVLEDRATRFVFVDLTK